MTIMKRPLVLALAVALSACEGAGDNDVPMGGDPPPPDQEEDAGTTPEPGQDAGVVDAPIPIELWVHDLIENHSGDEALPDTVDDKNIKDNEDPALFDAYFDATP
jgi:hypothetical protein